MHLSAQQEGREGWDERGGVGWERGGVGWGRRGRWNLLTGDGQERGQASMNMPAQAHQLTANIYRFTLKRSLESSLTLIGLSVS